MTARPIRLALFALGLAGAAGAATAQTYTPAYRVDSMAQQVAQGYKVLLSYKNQPPEGSYEVLGPIYVNKHWFGDLDSAKKELAAAAREMGANVVLETRLWLAPAFPVPAAPHGQGIALRIRDTNLIEELTDQFSTWE